MRWKMTDTNVVEIATVATVPARIAAERAAMVPLGKAMVVLIPLPNAPNLASRNAVEKLMNPRTRRGKHTKRCGDP